MTMQKVNLVLRYNKAKNWTGRDLKGDWLVTYKIDGVRAFLDQETKEVFSRAKVPLPKFPEELKDVLINKCKGLVPKNKPIDFEVYGGSWDRSITITRNKNSSEQVTLDDIYILQDEVLDKRLIGPWLENPTAKHIKTIHAEAVKQGFEGLVLRQLNKWYRVKSKFSYDVPVTGVTEGKGKYRNAIGALVTPFGDVGSGLTNDIRRRGWYDPSSIIGRIIEVECYAFTEEGKFWHPSFIRFRDDK